MNSSKAYILVFSILIKRLVWFMKTKYRCDACNWKFTRNYNPSLCPYCGRASVATDSTQAADELLRELD